MPNSMFFDKLADQWDNTRMPDSGKITELVQLIGLRPGDRVLDAGCGTGVLIPFVNKATGPAGVITALDYSRNMIARAESKYGSIGHINFVVCDIMQYEPESLFNAVICFNFFPHVQDKPGFFRHVAHILKDRGKFIIMHDISRHAVNGVHQSCEVVESDLLPPGETVKKHLLHAGYDVKLVIDNDDRYFIKAIK